MRAFCARVIADALPGFAHGKLALQFAPHVHDLSGEEEAGAGLRSQPLDECR